MATSVPNRVSRRPHARAVAQYYHGSGNGHLETAPSMLPGEDGWRTPTIEDLEHCANRPNGAGYPFGYRRSSLPPTKEETGNGENDGAARDETLKHISWPQRMKHVTWAWFTLTMATGGIANVLHSGIFPLVYLPFNYVSFIAV